MSTQEVHEYMFLTIKLLQAIQFSQTVLLQSIQYSISIDFVYAQLNVKRVLFQVIQFSMNTQFTRQSNSISSNLV